MNGTNIILDLVFVLGFAWGVEGVAIATFLAEWSGLALGLWLCRSAFQARRWTNTTLIFERARLKEFTNLSGDILIRSLLLEAIFVSFLFFGSDFGDVTLAANQILLQFLHITAYAMDGFAFSAEALVGQAIGKKKPQLVRRSAILASQWGLVTGCGLAVFFFVFGGWIIGVMTTAPDVRSESLSYLNYLVFAPILGCAAWMLDGIFIGATRGRDMRNMMVISAAIYFLAVMALVPTFGNSGLWLALLISFVARGVSLGIRYPALERGAFGR